MSLRRAASASASARRPPKPLELAPGLIEMPIELNDPRVRRGKIREPLSVPLVAQSPQAWPQGGEGRRVGDLGEPPLVLADAVAPGLPAAGGAEVKDRRLVAHGRGGATRDQALPEVPVGFALEPAVPAARGPGRLDTDADGRHDGRVGPGEALRHHGNPPVQPAGPAQRVVRPDGNRRSLQDLGPGSRECLGQTLQMVGKEQVVIAQPHDHLASRQLQGAVAVLVGVTRELVELERLDTLIPQPTDRLGGPVGAAVTEHQDLLGRLALSQGAANGQQHRLAPIVRRDRDREGSPPLSQT